MNQPPFLSIITPCLNRAGFVAEAVESALNQNYPQFEHLLMDGGSTDGTLEILAGYPHLRVTSQKDQGIYDAINKGIQSARGEVIGIINTDDYYLPSIFETVALTFINHPEIEALSGGAGIFYKNNRGEQVTLATYPGVESDNLLFRATQGSPVFNAWFFRRGLFDRLGLFDLRYRYVADRDFLIRMALNDIPFASADQTFYLYRMHPGSFTLSGQDSGEAAYMFENRALAERYLQKKGLRPEDYRCFQTWHSQITLEHIMAAWRKKAFRRIAQYMSVGKRYNSGWWILFLRKLFERLPYILLLKKEKQVDIHLP